VPRVSENSAKVDVGSLFVPSRVSTASRGNQPSSVTTSPTACRIAGLQRQPAFQDDTSSTGLLLPPQRKMPRAGERRADSRPVYAGGFNPRSLALVLVIQGRGRTL